MRGLVARVLFAVALTSLAGSLVLAHAAGKQEQPPPADDLPPLDIVPLVDENAPLVLIWFTVAENASIEDATALESQIFEEIGKRMDMRAFSRNKTLRLVNTSSNKKLQYCRWEDPCLKEIATLAKADRVIGVKMSGHDKEYFLAFKRIDMTGDDKKRSMKIVSGGMTGLLMSGISRGLNELFGKPEKAVQPKDTPTPPEEKAPAPKTGEAPKDIAPIPKTADSSMDIAPVPIVPVPIAPKPDPKPEPAPIVAAPVEAPAAQEKPIKSEPEAPAPKTTPIAEAPTPKVVIAPPPTPPKVEIVQAETVDEAPPPPVKPGFFRRHLGSTIALGVGLVAAGTGIGFGSVADQARQDVEFQYDPALDADGRDNALVANVMFGLAGAAAVTAIILFVLEPGADADAQATVAAAPGGALLRF
jgi:hypothetical protein